MTNKELIMVGLSIAQAIIAIVLYRLYLRDIGGKGGK